MIVWSVIIGALLALIFTAIVFLFWMVKDLKSAIETYCISMENYHDCDDFLICDEGHPEKPFKCNQCGKRY